MAKFLKISLIILLSLCAVAATLILTFFIITKDARLDESKLLNPNRNILIYDKDGNEITSANTSGNHKSVSLEALEKHTINAFIASEDRTFYSHNGLNYKRMLKAFYKNIVSRSFKEGASTISQQLIKNTHLSQEKTIKRKLNEIKLTLQLEKRYSKDEILEMYLNTIYFGHSCYGLQSASEFYFDKTADKLTLTESATLVGLLSSPNNYSPFKNAEKCLQRRNLVLNAMLECNFIDEATCKTAKNQPINAIQTNKTGRNADYLNGIFDELEEINTDFYNLKNGCKIYTYLDTELQNFIENIDYSYDNSVIITSDGSVNAYKSSINGAKRQPGSTIKPLLVYAPALEEKILSPFTKILDEKVNYNGYSPENFDKKYHGYVSVTDSIKNSYNVPAVKTLNTLTVKTAEKYLTKMNIALEDDEKNLALALGGMKYGLSLKNLTDMYSVFPAGGVYTPSRFIKKIVAPNGKTIFENVRHPSKVFSEGTCSLMNEILTETAKNGTAKKLSGLSLNVAAKTGTCGNSEGNTDAYSICYTSDHSIGVWLGDKANKRTKVSGGNDCCTIAKDILSKLYRNRKPKKLDTQSGTSEVNIDAEEYYENNKIILADPACPKLNLLKVKTLRGNEPKETSDRFSSPSIPAPTVSVKNNAVNIELCHAKYYAYIIKRHSNGKIKTIYDGKWQKCITDSPPEGYYTYTVTPYFLDGDKKIYGQEITLPAINLNKNNTSPQVKIPDIANKNWFDL